MRIVTLALAAGLGLVGCDEMPRTTPEPPPMTGTTGNYPQVVPYSPSVAPTEATAAGYAACVEADNKANENWLSAYQGQPVQGDLVDGDFRRRLQTMVDACSPILSMGDVTNPDPARDKIVQKCVAGYRAKITAYQGLLDGNRTAMPANKMLEGAALLKQCDEMAAKLTTD